MKESVDMGLLQSETVLAVAGRAGDRPMGEGIMFSAANVEVLYVNVMLAGFSLYVKDARAFTEITMVSA